MWQPTAVGPRATHRLRSRRPRRTIQARLALSYFGVFLISGIVLLAATIGLWQGGSTARATPVVPVATSGAHAPRPASGGPPQVAHHGADLHQLLIAAGTALALMAAVSLALGWLVAGRFLKPLRAITMATREITASNLHERLNLARPDDEIKELGDTFDDLLERLERSFPVRAPVRCQRFP